MKVFYQWQEYPVAQGLYGSGGWSRNARRRPAPVVKEGVGIAVQSGKSWVVDGVRKLKLNLWSLEDGSELKRDYPELATPKSVLDCLPRAIHMAGLGTKCE